MDLPQVTQISAKEVSRRIKAAGVKDEWQVYCHLAGADHAAAYMLRRCVVWSGGKRVHDHGGWFYKSDDDWKIEACLSRRKLEASTKILESVGLAAEVRQVRVKQKYAVGKTVTHYRVDPKIFWEKLDAVLVAITGGCINCADDGMDESDNRECTDCTSGDAQNEHPVMDETYIGDGTKRASDDEQNEHLNLNLEGSSESSNQNGISEITLPTERDFLREFKNQFVDFEDYADALVIEVKRIGTEKSREVIARCKKLGQTWAYVLKAMTNTAGSVSPSPSFASPLPETPAGESMSDEDWQAVEMERQATLARLREQVAAFQAQRQPVGVMA